MKDNKPSPQLHLQFTKKHKRNSGTEGLSIGRDLIAEVGKKPNTDLDVFHITKEGRLALSSVQCYTDPELLCDFRLDGHAKQLSRSDFSGKNSLDYRSLNSFWHLALLGGSFRNKPAPLATLLLMCLMGKKRGITITPQLRGASITGIWRCLLWQMICFGRAYTRSTMANQFPITIACSR